MKRRKFLQGTALTLGASMMLPVESLNAATVNGDEAVNDDRRGKPKLRIGICGDIHLDLMPDGERRLKAFMDEMELVKPDFIIQLGDFCSPHAKNTRYVEMFNGFNGPSFHVIGNHDTDYGFSHQQVVDFLEMPGIYYSFDVKGFHFVVLNGNERPEGDTSRWPSHISKEQLNWLEKDLLSTSLPVIVFCHQGLDVNVSGAVQYSSRVRVVFERVNQAAGFEKVQVVFSGHHHQDYHNIINSIHYVQINSMSYYWMGSQYRRFRFTPEVDQQFPLVKDTAPYQDPIWAVLNIYDNGEYELAGRTTNFISPSPAEMGMPEFEKVYPVVPVISGRKFRIDRHVPGKKR
jgi:predicted phosphodiesterase